MFKIYNYEDNDDVQVVGRLGQFHILEWKRDLSVTPATAQIAYFSSAMNVRRRQLVAAVDPQHPVTLQAGAMQWTVGGVTATTGVTGVGSLLGKMVRSAVSSESAIKPEYRGNGTLVCEPTFNHLLLVDMKNWGGSIVLDDGLFLACDGGIRESLQARSNLSSAVAGGEGLFNLKLVGEGAVVLESPVPQQECVYVDLQDDVLKIDGSYALAWSSTLDFTVERSGKTLVGSAASGEGLVNVYRGTGRVMMAPMR